MLEKHTDEHMVQPKMVYISHPTELGTLYSRQELASLRAVCRENGLYLFLDGARLGYAMASAENDVVWQDLAWLCDAFYIGGTKVGALLGEAVVIANKEISRDFRYAVKQRGGMLAKGWLLGVQFDTLFQNELYVEIAKHAVHLADKLRKTLHMCGYPLLLPGSTNQVFPVFSDSVLAELEKDFCFTFQQRIDECHQAVRICTSWATKPEDVEALCSKLTLLCAEKQERNPYGDQ